MRLTIIPVMPMPDAFEGILGQPQVRDFLRASVKSEHVTHAYLFTGPAGSNKTAAAFALAKALICPKGSQGPRGGACGSCDNCAKVGKRTHPDVHFYEPEGATGYLIDQVREIVADVSYAPIQADKKIYIIDRVDLMGVSPANAFLKTLEEPPDNVVLILLGRTRESVLPTIASRCQVVPFRHIPPSEAAGIISQNTGASIQQSKQALEASGGSMTRAIGFLRAAGNERVGFRANVMRMLAKVPGADDWALINMARDLVTQSKAPLDSVRVQLEEELAENADFLEKSAIRQIEAKNKRRISMKSLEYLRQTIDIVKACLRDIMVVCAGAPELMINTDFEADIKACAAHADEARISHALAEIERAEEALKYNVSPETCLDTVLFAVREGIDDTRSAG